MTLQIVEANAGAHPDPLLERLVRSLLPPDQATDILRGYYADASHTGTKLRLQLICNEPAASKTPRPPLALQQWRLRRVAAFVDSNLDQPLPLTCLANAAGLSRMHFAALFRRATGQRPHDYVAHRRIERAQQRLARTRLPIAEIALSVGFQSQAHFTSVFKRIAGTTPHQWRLTQEPVDIAA